MQALGAHWNNPNNTEGKAINSREYFASMVWLHLDRMVTANQCSIVLSDYIYPVMKHFYPDGIVSSRKTVPQFIWQKGSLNDLMSMKMM